VPELGTRAAAVLGISDILPQSGGEWVWVAWVAGGGSIENILHIAGKWWWWPTGWAPVTAKNRVPVPVITGQLHDI
jgi:hypothetical protein